VSQLVASWTVAAVIAAALTLGAGVPTVFAIAALWRLRRDARVIEAAESFQAVDLTTVIKRYVPAEHQTNRASDEMAIAKQVIVARRPRQKWIVGTFGLVLVGGAIATAFSLQRHWEMRAAADLARKPRSDLDVLKSIQGLWGWRADFLLSCGENPQTIEVAPDRKTLTLRYAKPSRQGSETLTKLSFDVVAAKPDKLMLQWTDPPAGGKPSPVEVRFIDANTMSWSSSNDATVSSGAIERCGPTHLAGNVAVCADPALQKGPRPEAAARCLDCRR
jgi:hypothetical protein